MPPAGFARSTPTCTSSPVKSRMRRSWTIIGPSKRKKNPQATSIRRPVAGIPKKSPECCPVTRPSSATRSPSTIRSSTVKREVGEGGKPEAVDALDVGAPLEDTAGGADDDAFGGVVGGQGNRVPRAPRGFAPLEQGDDLLARHDRLLTGRARRL